MQLLTRRILRRRIPLRNQRQSGNSIIFFPRFATAMRSVESTIDKVWRLNYAEMATWIMEILIMAWRTIQLSLFHMDWSCAEIKFKKLLRKPEVISLRAKRIGDISLFQLNEAPPPIFFFSNSNAIWSLMESRRRISYNNQTTGISRMTRVLLISCKLPVVKRICSTQVINIS